MFRFLSLIGFLSFAFNFGNACTAFQLKASDGSYIYCRSMEYGFNLNSNLLIVPRGMQFVGSAPGGVKGITSFAKYGYVGMNQAFAPNLLSDGMNEAGLVVSSLYLPGYAAYEKYTPSKVTRTLAAWEVPSFLLGICSSVDDVKQILTSVVVADQTVPGFNNFVLPLHFYVGDKTGKVLIVEYVGGKLNLYDNPLGVLTNSPPFDWHLTNMGNFVNLSPVNVQSLDLKTYDVRKIGQGSGLLGLPGDYTPPSRFLRATLFSQWATQKATAIETVNLGFHILNTFDIFDGIIRNPPQPQQKRNQPVNHNEETTQWVIVHDRTNLKTYFRGYNSLEIQMVDLTRIDFSKPGYKQIKLENNFIIKDETDKASPL